MLKKIPIFLLTMAMLFTSAYATDIAAPGTGSSTAKVSQTASVISVSIPTGLPVTVISDGTVTTSTDAKIVNNSYGPIKVTNIQLNGANSWSLVDYTTNFKALKVGLKQFGFKLQGLDVPNTGLAFLTGFTSINGGAEIPITYSAKVASQHSAIIEDVGNIVITISWDKAESAYGEVPANVTDYYNFGLNLGKYGLHINPAFRAALQANGGAGAAYKDWNPGDPLPNPGSTYNSTPVNSMYSMFTEIMTKSLDLSLWDTSNITNMNEMFFGCELLTSLNLSSFNTSNVTTMSSMFESCVILVSLDLSSFDTSKVTNTGGMFALCSSLKSLDLRTFDTSNIQYMNSMFSGCSSITALELSSFNTSNVINMNSMFGTCGALTSLDLSSFDTSKVTDMGYMFYFCNSITEAYAKTTGDVTKFNAAPNKPAGLTFVVKP